MRSIFAIACLTGTVLAAELPPDFEAASPPGAFVARDAVVSRAPHNTGEPVVSTTYFYWYDIDTQTHFRNGDGSDALTTHPANTGGMSWRNPQWHAQQFRQMAEAGIDVALPVYWGSPTAEQPVGMRFSDEGVPAMVAALDAITTSGATARGDTARGDTVPTLGLFYDTSTLENNVGAFHIDLTTDAGKRWFYATIRNFFSMVPPRHRATIDGKPLVVLYAAAFAKKQDATLFPAVREMFKRDFGTDLYIVKTPEWLSEADSIYQWGAALSFQDFSTGAVGAGYDHSAVPGRTPLVRKRDDGDFYRLGWERLLRQDPLARPFLVHIETWNEFHEGTDIAESREYGTLYLRLTKHYTSLWHARKRLEKFSVASKFSAPSATPKNEAGIAVRPAPFPGDGPCEFSDIDSVPVWVVPQDSTRPASLTYIYFDVDGTFLLEPVPAVELKVRYRFLAPQRDINTLEVHFDSSDAKIVGLMQAFKTAKLLGVVRDGEWCEATFLLEEPRFSGRSNGADFRICCRPADRIAVASVAISVP